MKKLMYLAITFFTFIFSFIAPIKNNFNININNNKLVEKLEPKRAFENAPIKETSLPGFNKEFKIYFNISNLNDFKDFFNYLNSYDIKSSTENSVDFNILYYGNGTIIEEDTTSNVEITMSAYKTNDNLCFTIRGAVDGHEYLNFIYYYNINTEQINFIVLSGQSQQPLTDTLLSQQMSLLNSQSVKIRSYNSVNIANMNINVDSYLKNQSFIYGYDLVSSSAVPGLIGTISSIATGLLSLLISLFSSVVAIFWNVSNNTPTFLGVIILFVVAVPITYWVINFVIGLIRKIRLTRGK